MAELQLRRDLPYPPARVWSALTDATALAGWFWPPRLGTTAECEPRPGGRYRIASPVVGIAVSGEYSTVDRPHRLAFTWRWDGESATTEVSLELDATGVGTTVTVHHGGFGDDAVRDEHVQGWSDCLDRMPGWLDATDRHVTG